MKNYQQTPKQRRANLEKAKRELRHSNPKRQFSQGWESTFKVTKHGRYVYDKYFNSISYRGHKL